MASSHTARVVRVDRFASGGSLLRLRMEEPLSLAHQAGQYIIVNSGQLYPNGKAGKRAYSLFAADAGGQEFHLAAERVMGGLVSNYLHELQEGDELVFSGPWGKFQPPAGGWDRTRPLLGVAVATGITALMGLLGTGELPPDTRLVWMRDPRAAFLPDACVFDLLPAGVRDLQLLDWPAEANDEPRLFAAIEEQLEQLPLIYAAGEGQTLDQLERLVELWGLQPGSLVKESFFRRLPPPAV